MEYAPSHTSPVRSPATFNADFPCSKSTGAMLPLHLAESSSLAAATCLTISLGFLATHLAIKLSIMLKTKYRYFSPGEDCAVADLPLLVQKVALVIIPLALCACVRSIRTSITFQPANSHSPKSLGDGEALVTDDGEACLDRGRPLKTNQILDLNKYIIFNSCKPGEWRPHCPL